MFNTRSLLDSVLSGFAREPIPSRRRRKVLPRAWNPAAEPLERRDLLAAFLKIEGIAGDSTDPGHDDWILINAAIPVFRSIPGTAVDQRRPRPRPETSLGEVTFTRQMDKTSPRLMEACALGRFNEDIRVDFTIPVAGTEVPYLSYTFHDLAFASYRIQAESSGPETTAETLTLTYKSAELRFFRVNPVTGEQTDEVTVVQAPPTVGLSSTTVAENRPAGTVVGRLSTPHGYTNETYTYKLVAGAGSRDNQMFRIVGDKLQTRSPLSYAGRKSYSIRVQSSATDGSAVVKTFTIGVVKAAAAVRPRAFVSHR